MENVNHPAHYNSGGIEVIDVIEDWGLGFCLGNALKYICRAGRKTNDPTEDLKKAQCGTAKAAKPTEIPELSESKLRTLSEWIQCLVIWFSHSGIIQYFTTRMNLRELTVH